MLTRMRKKGIRFVPLLALIIVLATFGTAYALTASLPVVANNGDISCPTCATESSPSQYGIPVWGTTQEFGVITPSAQTSYVLRSNGSSANPSFGALAIGDFPSTITTGSTGVTKLATYASGSTTAGRQLQFDANGNIEASSYATGAAGSIVPAIDVSPIGPLTVAAATKVYCGLDGQCCPATVCANGVDVQTRYTGTGTFVGLNCAPTAATTNAITAKLRAGTCNGALATGDLDFTLATTAWGAGSAAGTSTAFTTGQCVVLEFSAGTDAAKTGIRCSVRQSAGAAS